MIFDPMGSCCHCFHSSYSSTIFAANEHYLMADAFLFEKKNYSLKQINPLPVEFVSKSYLLIISTSPLKIYCFTAPSTAPRSSCARPLQLSEYMYLSSLSITLATLLPLYSYLVRHTNSIICCFRFASRSTLSVSGGYFSLRNSLAK